MDKLTWKDKHNILLRNRDNIIKKYDDNVPIRLIAREYGAAGSCIYRLLKQWGKKRRSGIKHLLGKILLEGD